MTPTSAAAFQKLGGLTYFSCNFKRLFKVSNFVPRDYRYKQNCFWFDFKKVWVPSVPCSVIFGIAVMEVIICCMIFMSCCHSGDLCCRKNASNCTRSQSISILKSNIEVLKANYHAYSSYKTFSTNSEKKPLEECDGRKIYFNAFAIFYRTFRFPH